MKKYKKTKVVLCHRLCHEIHTFLCVFVVLMILIPVIPTI